MFSCKRISRIAVVVFSLFFVGLANTAEIVVGTWNTKRLGHGSKQDYHALAEIAGRFDLLALQEVMNESGLEHLVETLESHTGQSWSMLVSHAIGTSSYKEHYAFVWKNSTVSYDGGAVVYLDRANHFIREPFSARFSSRVDGSTFALGTVHILYGQGISDRTPEINALAEYWDWLAEVYPDTPVLLAGDFNLKPSHEAWRPLKRSARPLLTRGATTLSSKNGRYANLYDNIWVEIDSHLNITSAGIVDFPTMLNLNHEASRATVSDHAPVYVALGAVSFDGTISTNPLRDPTSRNGQTSTLSARPHVSSAGVRGNRNSRIYHRPDCPSYERVSQKNRVEFSSAAEAQASGFRLAGNC